MVVARDWIKPLHVREIDSHQVPLPINLTSAGVRQRSAAPRNGNYQITRWITCGPLKDEGADGCQSVDGSRKAVALYLSCLGSAKQICFVCHCVERLNSLTRLTIRLDELPKFKPDSGCKMKP